MLISLSIGSLLGAALLIMIHQAIRANQTTQRIEKDTYTSLKLRSLLQRVVQDADSHRLPLFPKILPRGSSPAEFQEAESDILLSIHLHPEYSFLITQQQGFNIEFCKRYSDQQILTYEPDGYIALGGDGITEVRLETISTRQDGCGVGKIFPIQPHFTEATESFPIRYLIPIGNLYAIYLDSGKVLRYIGFENGSVIENQPILTGLRDLSFSMEPIISNKLFVLSSQIVTLAGHKESISFTNHIGKTASYNFLLNVQ